MKNVRAAAQNASGRDAVNVKEMCDENASDVRDNLLLLDALEIERKKAEAHKKRLNENKMNLEMEVEDICDAQTIDRDKCMHLRESLPITIRFI